MVYTVCRKKEQSNYGLHCVSLQKRSLWSTLCVIRKISLIMVYTVSHQKEHSNYGQHCVSSEESV